MKSIVHILKLEDGSKKNLDGLRFSNCIGIILQTYKYNIHELIIAQNVYYIGPTYSVLVNNKLYYLCLENFPFGNRYILYNFIEPTKSRSRIFSEYYTTKEQNIRFV